MPLDESVQPALEARILQHLAIDQYIGHSSPEEVDDGGVIGPTELLVEFAGPVQCVAREDHVIQPEKRIVRRQRLRLEHVEPRTRNAAVDKSIRQCPLIHYAASGGVDQVCAPLHKSQAASIDQMASLAAQGAVDGNEIRLREKLVQRPKLRTQGERVLVSQGGIVDDKGKTERPRYRDEMSSDGPASHQPQDLALRFDTPDCRPAAPSFWPFESEAMLIKQPGGGGEDQRQRSHRCRALRGVARDHKRYPGASQRREVAVFIADADADDRRQLRGIGNRLRIDRRTVRYRYQDVDIRQVCRDMTSRHVDPPDRKPKCRQALNGVVRKGEFAFRCDEIAGNAEDYGDGFHCAHSSRSVATRLKL